MTPFSFVALLDVHLSPLTTVSVHPLQHGLSNVRVLPSLFVPCFGLLLSACVAFTFLVEVYSVIPSLHFDVRSKIFDQVFQSGVAPYQEPAVLEVYRLVTGKQFDDIKPYFATDSPYRGTYSGASGLFTADKPEATSAEVLGTLGFKNAPSPSYLLRYGFSGEAVRLDRVHHAGFQQEFTQVTGFAKHEFSQDCRYYLELHEMISGSQALAWTSVSGVRLGISGQTYMVLPPFSGALQFRDYDRVG